MPDPFNFSGSTILVLDDSPLSMSTVLGILEKSGYRTLSAMNGPECMQLAKTSKPDVILLDIIMPGMSGIEVCRVLTEDEETNDIPIIFVTGNTDDKILEEAFEAGGTDYVRKPVGSIELTARIKSALAHKMLLKQQLEDEKLKGVLELAGAVCHEMNQPLQVIYGYSNLLRTHMSENHPQYDYISQIQEHVARMGEITNKLMNITRYKTRNYIAGQNIFDIDQASDTDE
jgi:CheY-like chemotaxis protein